MGAEGSHFILIIRASNSLDPAGPTAFALNSEPRDVILKDRITVRKS